MNVDLDREQRARIELMAIYAGTSPSQMLLAAAECLLNTDPLYPERHALPYPAQTQRFLSEADLELRFRRMLRH